MKIYKKFSIKGPGRVNIGKNCTVAGIKGDKSQYVTIDTHSPDATISIGDDAALCAARISSRFRITIGDSVLIEEAGITDTDFHSINRARGNPTDEDLEKCEVLVGNRVCIGARSFITKGVRVGDNAIICPGSIVVAPIKANTLVYGNPARAYKKALEE